MAWSGWIGTAAGRIGARQAELKLALRVTVAGTLAYAITKFFSLPQGYWAAITAVVVTQASLGGSLKAAIERFLGTLAGAAYGGLVAALVPHESPLGMGLAVILGLFPLALLASIWPSFRVAPVTGLIMLLPPTGQAIGPISAAVDRVAEITLGNVVGVVISLFVVPARAHTLMMEAAARVVSLNAGLIELHISELLAEPKGRSALQTIHPRIRAALKKAEAAAEEAARERRSHLTGAPDPEPLIRTLYRVRHDLVMIGRASASPLPERILDRLGPSLRALRDETCALLLDIAQSLRTRTPPPNAGTFEAALRAFMSETESLRSHAFSQDLPYGRFGQVFALGFAFEQFRKNVSDLLARTEELAQKGNAEAAG
ncbi:FUSC family protein [Microvirga makkahensis]|uniref:FUSC family protein n=1 Tax=Microvirga makkahensis TaxID=1128670 RepID=A0A7X3MQ35_9HYPH|nr:FUSC family protein [Microvirga makkahensis]MXQ11085.1 FUSC family protein [Microvirga makkahensis]